MTARAITALAKHKPIIKEKDFSLNIKLRSYNVYVSSAFLYNSEACTLINETLSIISNKFTSMVY
mgnify:CR=1 FL=1